MSGKDASFTRINRQYSNNNASGLANFEAQSSRYKNIFPKIFQLLSGSDIDPPKPYDYEKKRNYFTPRFLLENHLDKLKNVRRSNRITPAKDNTRSDVSSNNKSNKDIKIDRRVRFSDQPTSPTQVSNEPEKLIENSNENNSLKSPEIESWLQDLIKSGPSPIESLKSDGKSLFNSFESPSSPLNMSNSFKSDKIPSSSASKTILNSAGFKARAARKCVSHELPQANFNNLRPDFGLDNESFKDIEDLLSRRNKVRNRNEKLVPVNISSDKSVKSRFSDPRRRASVTSPYKLKMLIKSEAEMRRKKKRIKEKLIAYILNSVPTMSDKWIHKIIDRRCNTLLKSLNFNATLKFPITELLCNDLLLSLKVMLNEKRKHRLVINVIVLQDCEQSVCCASRCLWDPETDNFSSYNVKINNMYLIVTVYWIEKISTIPPR